MSTETNTLIVGGGIAGLATAIALARIGQRTTLVERAGEFSEIGAGIQMGPNGFRMLEALGLRQAIDPVAVFPDDLVVMDGVSATEITRIPAGVAFRERFGYPYALVHRADLHRALLDACRGEPLINLRSGVSVASFRAEAEHVSVTTVDDSVLEASALIGADGLWSTVRQAIVSDGPPRISGHIAYRAVLPIEDIEPQFRQNAMILWAGPRNHLVQYPLRGGKLFNLVAVFHSDKYVEGWDRQGDRDELHRRFARNCPAVRTLLEKVDTWRMWVLCDREPVRTWSSGRVTLVGDAAHPMLQYLAQGAGMALEDAVILSRALQQHDGRYESAFRAYEASRYLRTGRCQVMARIYGGFYHAEGVTRELATAFLAGRSVPDSYASLEWLYDYRPESANVQ